MDVLYGCKWDSFDAVDVDTPLCSAAQANNFHGDISKLGPLFPPPSSVFLSMCLWHVLVSRMEPVAQNIFTYLEQVHHKNLVWVDANTSCRICIVKKHGVPVLFLLWLKTDFGSYGQTSLWQCWWSRLTESFKLDGIKNRAGTGQGYGPFKVRILYKWILCFSSSTQLYLSVIQHSVFVRKLHV